MNLKLDDLIDVFCDRNELLKSDDDHVVNDDTQVGIEFAYEQISNANEGFQLVSEKAIEFLFENHPEAYKEFYKLVDKK